VSFNLSNYILVLYNSPEIIAFTVGVLPADGVDGTCHDRVVDIVSFVAGKMIHTGESIIVEKEHVSRDGATRTASDA
jgi:hypothetical protein